MEKVLKDGFLDDYLNKYLVEFRKENKKYYDVVIEYNSLAYEIISNFVRVSCDSIDLYLFSTFIQIHKSFQSFIILTERGLHDEAQIILRTMYEKLFNLKMTIKDSNFMEMIYQKHNVENKSLYEYIQRNQFYDILSKDKIVKGINEFNKEIKLDINGKIIKYPTIKKITENLGMEREYLYYKTLCNNVHAGLVTTNDIIKKENGGYYLDGGLQLNDFFGEMIKSFDCLSNASISICNYINRSDFIKKISELEQKVEMLYLNEKKEEE